MLLTLFYMVILLRNFRSVCLFKAPHHEDIWGNGGPRITPAKEAEEDSTSVPSRPRKESPVATRWMENGWVPVGRGVVEKKCVLRKSDSGSTTVHRVALLKDKFYKQHFF